LTYWENASRDKLTFYAGDIRFVPSDNEERNFGQISFAFELCGVCRRFAGGAWDWLVARSGQSHWATAEVGAEYKNTEGMRDDEALPDIVTREFHHNYCTLPVAGSRISGQWSLAVARSRLWRVRIGRKAATRAPLVRQSQQIAAEE
jgi:hypothetical protein